MNSQKDGFLYSIVMATDLHDGFGYKGGLPWNLHQEMKHFKFITSLVDIKEKQNVIVMGRKTWESIPQKFRPLSDRINIVFTEDQKFIENNPDISNSLYCVKDFTQFENILDKIKDRINEIFVIGGKGLLDSFQKEYPDKCKLVFHSRILKEYPCDVKYKIPKGFEVVFESSKFYDKNEDTYFNYRILVNKTYSGEVKSILNPKYIYEMNAGAHPLNSEVSQ